MLRVETTYSGNSAVSQMVVAGAGEARIRIDASGVPVWPAEGAVLKVAPPLLRISSTIRLGKDLQVNLPLTIGAGSSDLRRGVVTIRSEDPSRLLLSLDATAPGSASVSYSLSQPEYLTPTVWAQALSNEGEVRVVFSSPEFSGDAVTVVHLEPARLRWGFQISPSREVEPSAVITAGRDVFLLQQFEGASGSIASGQRPGAPEGLLRVSNSADQVVEVNRATIRGPLDGLRIVGLAAGVATLSLTATAPMPFELANSSVRVEVTTPASRLVSPPAKSMIVGKDLQAQVLFRYLAPGGPVSVNSEAPSAILVSPSVSQPGQASVQVTPEANSDWYSFFVQGSRESGEGTVVIKYPDGEFPIRVTLAPSGIGLRPWHAAAGFDQGYEVGMHALDETTGIPLDPQRPAPGKRFEARLRTTGSAVRLSRETVVLGSSAGPETVSVTLPPLGEEAELIAESEGSSSRQTLRRLPQQISTSGPATVMQDTVASLTVGLLEPSSELPRTVKATSSDPAALLLSLDRGQPGSATIELNPTNGERQIYLQGMQGARAATVTIEASGFAPSEIVITLAPLRLVLDAVNGGASLYLALPMGRSAPFSYRVPALAWRPGADPVRFRLRTSDAAVATVSPSELELGGAKLNAAFSISGVGAGSAELMMESERGLTGFPPLLTIAVQDPLAIAPTVTELSIGGNTQMMVRFLLGQPNPNGTIATVTSSDASRLVVSRNQTGLGGGSTTLAIQPGVTYGEVYLQALGADGEATVTAAMPGFAQQRWRVRLVRAWFVPRLENSSSQVRVGEARLLQQESSRTGQVRPVRCC